MEANSENKKDIEISILKGDKLFNENTPFVINLFAPESNNKSETRVNTDLICVIDISRSMKYEKIYQVKQSLKILIDMMEQKDRIAIVLFHKYAELLYDLDYLSENKKSDLKYLIDKIKTKSGTNIASGLEIAVDILKKEKQKINYEEGRASTVILLSDGCDNYMNDVKLGEKLKSLTKGEGLSFTLNTFGYGYDHDPKIMNRLANLRDGSFFLVEDYNKVGEYFVSVLGGCISMISKNAQLEVKLINDDSKIMKIFGEKNLYSYELKDLFFKNNMLQFIIGKEYTFVLEILIDESKVKPDDIILEVTFTYEDILTKENITLNKKYIYELKDLNFSKANEEYIRSKTYDVLERALKLREKDKYGEGKKLLKDMKNWLKKNYKGNNNKYIIDIENAEQIFENSMSTNKSIINTFSLVSQNKFKRMGSNLNYSNDAQLQLQNQFRINLRNSQTINSAQLKNFNIRKSIKFD